MPIPFVCENNYFLTQVLFYCKRKIKRKNIISFLQHALRKNSSAKTFLAPASWLYAPAEFSVHLFQHLMCLLQYYQDEFTNRLFCKSGWAMLQIALVLQHVMCHVHYYGRIGTYFVENLVSLNHAKHLQSHSPK